MDEFISKMLEILELEEGDLEPSTEYRTLEEWDSLCLLSTLAMLQDDYNVTVSNQEIRGTTTIQDLFDLVEARAA